MEWHQSGGNFILYAYALGTPMKTLPTQYGNLLFGAIDKLL